MNLQLIAHVASNHPLASGVGDYVQSPNFDTWKAFAPMVAQIVGALSSLAVIVGIAMAGFNVVLMGFTSRNAEKYAVARQAAGRALLVAALGGVLVVLFLKFYPIILSFAKK